MEVLEPVEDRRLERKSSIYQFRHMLAVRRGDEWVPIAFDVLDGFLCNKALTHKAVLTDKPYIGYAYPVRECTYISDLYVAGQQRGTEIKVLPEWFGGGFYESYYDRDVVVNGANGALGARNTATLRVGTDYVLAKESLDPVA